MKTIAFAGQHEALVQLIKKYANTNYTVDIMHHQMGNQEQVKMLVSKSPYDPESNPYQWTLKASKIFVCVDANHNDFSTHLNDEIRNSWFEPSKVVMVGLVNDINQPLDKFREFAACFDFPLIICSQQADNAYYFKDQDVANQPLNTLLDNVISDSLVLEPQIENEEPVAENRRRKCIMM